MRQQDGCDQRRFTVLSCDRQVSSTGDMRIIKHIQNKLALKLHQLDWLSYLSAFWDDTVSLNECVYLLAACHSDATCGFRFVQFANADDLERVWRQPGRIRAHSILVILLIDRSDICCGQFFITSILSY